MRVLVVFLIILNIGFFNWAGLQDSEQVSLLPGKKVLSYKILQTIAERDDSIDTLEKSEHEDVSSVSQKLGCMSLGPFADTAELDVIYTRMLNQGIDAMQKSIHQRIPKSYWVYLVPHKSLESAYRTVAYLEEKNIKEHFIMRAPEEKRFSISLGLFSELGPANELMKKIEGIELDPKLEIRFDDVTEYWIHYQVDNKRETSSLLDDVLAKNESLSVSESDCSYN